MRSRINTLCELRRSDQDKAQELERKLIQVFNWIINKTPIEESTDHRRLKAVDSLTSAQRYVAEAGELPVGESTIAHASSEEKLTTQLSKSLPTKQFVVDKIGQTEFFNAVRLGLYAIKRLR